MDQNDYPQYSLGMIGLGTMGRNLLLNMADNGYNVTGYDRSQAMVDTLIKDGSKYHLEAFNTIEPFIKSIRAPRTIMLLVPAGPIVDSVIKQLKPLLQEGDVIIDSGNSHFIDTAKRAKDLSEVGLHFFGMGISGGEEGARHGPSMMPGGDKDAYNVVKGMLEDISAKVNGDPCVTYIGPGASGHFVKMVHNGIEYALMELIAETYDILRNNFSYSNSQIHDVFTNWNNGRLQSYLIEITKDIFAFKDVRTDKYLVDIIKDEAKSKGTGKWTSQVAMDLEVPLPTIDAAVSTRNLSKMKTLRTSLSANLQQEKKGSFDLTVDELEQAYYFSMVAAYAQGMHLLYCASKEYKYDLNLHEIAMIWRGGCIIRAGFLMDIYAAYTNDATLVHLYGDPKIRKTIMSCLPGIKKLVAAATLAGTGIPAFASTLSYYDGLKTERMPSNLTQAQRDFFGAHTYERVDEPGIFHADWNGDKL